MSRLLTSNLIGRASSNWAIEVDTKSYLNYRGAILQTEYRRSDNQVAYASLQTGTGTTITELELTIVPKRSNSILLCTWMLNAEVDWRNVFVIHRNRQLIEATGFQGYNSSNTGRFSGYVGAMYDNDNNTTMHNYYIQYAMPAGTTQPITIAPAIRSSVASNFILYLNRTFAIPSDAREVTVSTGMIQEIAQ
jgi:hypothetical protein